MKGRYPKYRIKYLNNPFGELKLPDEKGFETHQKIFVPSLVKTENQRDWSHGTRRIYPVARGCPQLMTKASYLGTPSTKPVLLQPCCAI